MHRRIRSIILTSAAATLIVGATGATAGPSGAIFTTNDVGTWVNGNVYADKEDVYLNGGPRVNQSCTAAGLPGGDYYFQVTDPSGEVLLSTDLLRERRIHINQNGVINAYLGFGHVVSPVEGRCSAHMVGLMPFADTPNPGGEYKVWLTPVMEDDHTCDASFECAGFFFPRNSKTDNFKVQAADVDDVPD